MTQKVTITSNSYQTPSTTIRGEYSEDATKADIIKAVRKVESRIDIFGWRDLRLSNGKFSIIVHTD